MYFALGYIAGIITSTLTLIFVFVILAYFRTGIERKVKIIEKQLGNAGPRPRGAIIMPDSDVEVARQKIIEKNREQGRDTPIDELRDN